MLEFGLDKATRIGADVKYRSGKFGTTTLRQSLSRLGYTFKSTSKPIGVLCDEKYFIRSLTTEIGEYLKHHKIEPSLLKEGVILKFDNDREKWEYWMSKVIEDI
jgi:hypothetical protein